MQLHKLTPAKGSVKRRKRIARGQGSGRGGTSTRGHKGDKSRSGFKNKRNFEGGQMPLQMRIPKRGFKNPNRVDFIPLNLDRLTQIAEKFNLQSIDFESLRQNGIIRKSDKIKVLGGGELGLTLNVTAHHFSAAAKEAIENKGGTVTVISTAPAETAE